MRDEFKRGDIWHCESVGNFDKGILSGPRPVLIISNDKWNADSPVVNVVLVSSNVRKYSPVHFNIKLQEESVINIEQIHTVPKDKLDYKIKTLTIEQINTISDLLKFQLGL